MIEHNTRFPAFTIPAQYSCEVLAVTIREGNRKYSNRKEIKVSLFANDTIFYIRDPKDSTRELLELINTLAK